MYRALRTLARTAQDHAPAAEGAAVAIDRGDADEAGDLAPIEGGRVRAARRSGCGPRSCRCPGPRRAGPRWHARRGWGRTAWSRSASISAQLLLQPGEVGVEPADEAWVAKAGGGAGPRCRSSRRAGGGGRPARRARAPPRPGIGRGSGRTRFGEARDGLGIQPIGLGEPAGGAGEVADGGGLTTARGRLCGGERGGDGHLEAAGGLEHDQAGCRARPGARPER